ENGFVEKRVGNSVDTAVRRSMLQAHLSLDLSGVNDIRAFSPDPQSDAFTCRVKKSEFLTQTLSTTSATRALFRR
ncbi:MAG TPA: hypothetical protein VM164_05020, partial [Burkholderiales bacterium]|nr:hypothetical protein [Burkholderiales bacterium]